MEETPPLIKDVWELYHVDEDFSEANNLAEKNPEKLKELQDLFMKEAVRNSVLPIDDRRAERFNPAIAGRPDIMGSRTSLTVYPGMVGMTENAFINVKNRSHTITANVELANANTNGVIIAQAGRFGGWPLFIKQGKVNYANTFFGMKRKLKRLKKRQPVSRTDQQDNPERKEQGHRIGSLLAQMFQGLAHRRAGNFDRALERVAHLQDNKDRARHGQRADE